MTDIEPLDVEAGRLRTHVLAAGPHDAPVILFVHGNLSSSVFWVGQLQRLADSFRVLAVDLRGFGHSAPLPVDATRGLADYADDVAALLDNLDVRRAHLVGWSMGGGVGWTVLRDRPELVASLTLVDPVSPYGYGGTIDAAGTVAFADDAGCGAGGVNPEFVQRLRDGDRSTESPFSPLSVIRALYFAPGFTAPDEPALLESVLASVIDDDHYPGDVATSPNWPGVRPGMRGVLNTMAPSRMGLGPLLDLDGKPPVRWVRGGKDQIVADAAALDLATLGQAGVLPDWPGPDVVPPQPMVAQTRHFLDAYAAAGGSYTETVFDDAGHSPHIEEPDRFADGLREFVMSAARP